MNFSSRAIAGKLLLSSRSLSRKYLLLPLHQQQQHHPLAVQHSSLYSTAARSSSKWSPPASQKQEQSMSSTSMARVYQNLEQVPPPGLVSTADWPRPSEIPWQSKVANSVSLIGEVVQPVGFEAAPDGKFWAGTIISRLDGISFSDSPPFWIPVIFEGDLAHVAACHVKPKDLVHIAGHLSADPLPPSITKIQGTYPLPPSIPQNQGKVPQVMVHSLNFVQGSSQVKKAFTPRTPGLDKNGSASEMRNDGGTVENSWMDLLINPQNWWDYRDNKLKGLITEKYPDFKHKDSGHSLWLDRAPREVLTKLDELRFGVQSPQVKHAKESKGDDLWKSLVENPKEWWDNRENKFNPKSPDFKHKETGKGLWLSDSPDWILRKLPPLKAKGSTF